MTTVGWIKAASSLDPREGYKRAGTCQLSTVPVGAQYHRGEPGINLRWTPSTSFLALRKWRTVMKVSSDYTQFVAHWILPNRGIRPWGCTLRIPLAWTGHVIALNLGRSTQQEVERGNSQDFPWVSTALKMPTGHVELNYPSVATSHLREGSCPQQSPSWNGPEVRSRGEQTLLVQGKKFSPWHKIVTLSEAGTKPHQGTKLLPGATDFSGCFKES